MIVFSWFALSRTSKSRPLEVLDFAQCLPPVEATEPTRWPVHWSAEPKKRQASDARDLLTLYLDICLDHCLETREALLWFASPWIPMMQVFEILGDGGPTTCVICFSLNFDDTRLRNPRWWQSHERARHSIGTSNFVATASIAWATSEFIFGTWKLGTLVGHLILSAMSQILDSASFFLK